MRYLIVLIALIAAGWSGYWYVGAKAQREGLSAGVSMLSSSGVEATYSGHELRGFPNRFDHQLDDLVLSASNWSWAAEEFEIYALSYKPNHLILEFPGTHRIRANGFEGEFSAASALASVILTASTRPAVDRITFEATEAVLNLNGIHLQPQRMQLSLRQAEEGLEFWLELENVLTPPMPGKLSNRIERVRASGAIPMTVPLNLQALVDGVDLENISFAVLQLIWDDLRTNGEGEIQNLHNSATAEFDLKIDGWSDIAPVVQSWAGLSDPTMRVLDVLMEVQQGEVGIRLSNGRLSVEKTPLSFRLY